MHTPLVKSLAIKEWQVDIDKVDIRSNLDLLAIFGSYSQRFFRKDHIFFLISYGVERKGKREFTLKIWKFNSKPNDEGV